MRARDLLSPPTYHHSARRQVRSKEDLSERRSGRGLRDATPRSPGRSSSPAILEDRRSKPPPSPVSSTLAACSRTDLLGILLPLSPSMLPRVLLSRFAASSRLPLFSFFSSAQLRPGLTNGTPIASTAHPLDEIPLAHCAVLPLNASRPHSRLWCTACRHDSRRVRRVSR